MAAWRMYHDGSGFEVKKWYVCYTYAVRVTNGHGLHESRNYRVPSGSEQEGPAHVGPRAAARRPRRGLCSISFIDDDQLHTASRRRRVDDAHAS